MQLTPFPLYPCKQSHVKDPIVLLQTAYEGWQLSTFDKHSSTSVNSAALNCWQDEIFDINLKHV